MGVKSKATVTVVGSRTNPFKVIKAEYKKHGVPEARDFIKEEGDKVAAEVQTNIFQQALPMKPLSQAYAAYKAKNEFDPRKLIKEGDYVAEIKARWVKGRTEVKIGLPRTKHPKDRLGRGGNITYEQLGKLLEYGSKKWRRSGGKKGMPARPHFGPTIAQWYRGIDRVNARLQKRVAAIIFKRLKRKYGEKRQKLT